MNRKDAGEEVSKKSAVIASGAVLVVIGTVFSNFFGFLTHTVAARFLGPDEYGVFALGLTVIATVTVLAKVGIPTGISRNLPRYEALEDKRGIVISGAILVGIASIVVTISLVLLEEFISVTLFGTPELGVVLLILAIAIPITSLQGVINHTFRGYENARVPVIIGNVAAPLLNALFVIPLVLGFGLIGAAVGWLTASALTGIVGLYLLRRKLPIIGRKFSAHYRMLLVFSLPLMFSNSAAIVTQQADNLMIGYFLTSADVGVYNLAYKVAKFIHVPQAAFGFLFFPVFSGLQADGSLEEMERLYKVVAKWMALGILPVLLIVLYFPDETLSVLFGENYSLGGIALVILATAFFYDLVLGLNGGALVAMGFTRFVMILSVLNALLNIAMNLVLIPLFGIAGAAAASAISYIIINTLHTLKLYAETGIHGFSVKTIAILAIGAVFLSVPYLLTMSGYMVPEQGSIFVILFILSYPLIYLRYGLGAEDIDILLKIEEKSGLDLSGFRWAASRIIEK